MAASWCRQARAKFRPQYHRRVIAGRGQRILLFGLLLVAVLAAVAPIRSYDYFWHLATGRWIVEHGALPLTDPFAVASERVPWINGEWLFEIVLYGLHQVIGTGGMSFVRGLLLVSILWLASAGPGGREARVVLFLSALAFVGVMPTFDIRPSSLAMLFVVIAIRSRSTAAHGINAVFWMNIHPSALLAPVIAALGTRRVGPAIASGLALLVNPFGFRGVLAPIELTFFVRSGQFVNAEWLPSPIVLFPLLYICIAIAVGAFATAKDKRAHWWHAALLLLFAFLAVRHVRHQPLFFAAFPLLVAPMIRHVPRPLAYATAVVATLFVAFTTDHRIGVAPERFPEQAVARLKASGLRGNIYNPDQFGGYLEHAFYPERRVLTDGRNELFRTYIPEYARARRDQRAWLAMLTKYKIDLAVEEYGRPLQVTDAVTRQTTSMAASLAFWPRQHWALIGFDRAGMVFARRAAFSSEVLAKWEIRGVVPDQP